MRKKRGTFGELENQFIKLKEENEKLKRFAMTGENIEQLLYENKILKLELQKLKSKSDDFYQLSPEKSEGKGGIRTSSDNKNYYNDMKTSKRLGEVGAGIINDIRDLRAASERLKQLQEMEKRSGLRIANELQRIKNEKLRQEEEKNEKAKLRNENIKKMKGHIKRLDYLYKDGANVHSNYLIQSKNNPLYISNDYSHRLNKNI